MAFDFVTRNTTGWNSKTKSLHIINQLPVLPPQPMPNPAPGLSPASLFSHSPLPPHLAPSPLLELTYTAWDLEPFAQDCGYDGPPFRWDEERRFLLRCELDAAYFHLYGIARDDVDYIMETFPIVKRKDEAKHGEYRTKRVILEIYDEMAAAIAPASLPESPRPAAWFARARPASWQLDAPRPGNLPPHIHVGLDLSKRMKKATLFKDPVQIQTIFLIRANLQTVPSRPTSRTMSGTEETMQ